MNDLYMCFKTNFKKKSFLDKAQNDKRVKKEEEKQEKMIKRIQ